MFLSHKKFNDYSAHIRFWSYLHTVMYTVDSVKVASGIEHLGLRNNAIICPSDRRKIASQCPIPNIQSNLYWISYIRYILNFKT